MKPKTELEPPLTAAQVQAILDGSDYVEVGEIPKPWSRPRFAKIRKTDRSAYLESAAEIGRFWVDGEDEKFYQLRWTDDESQAGRWFVSDAELMVAVIAEQLWISCLMEVCHE